MIESLYLPYSRIEDRYLFRRYTPLRDRGFYIYKIKPTVSRKGVSSSSLACGTRYCWDRILKNHIPRRRGNLQQENVHQTAATASIDPPEHALLHSINPHKTTRYESFENTPVVMPTQTPPSYHPPLCLGSLYRPKLPPLSQQRPCLLLPVLFEGLTPPDSKHFRGPFRSDLHQTTTKSRQTVCTSSPQGEGGEAAAPLPPIWPNRPSTDGGYASQRWNQPANPVKRGVTTGKSVGLSQD